MGDEAEYLMNQDDLTQYDTLDYYAMQEAGWGIFDDD